MIQNSTPAPATTSLVNEIKLPELAKPLQIDEACARHYTLTPLDANAHLLAVEMRVAFVENEQCFRLPSWIPGSYMIRDFAKHLLDLQAFDDEHKPLAITLLDKSTWCVHSEGRAINLRYKIYAWDLSVRTAHFDQTHAFFNGTSVFLEVIGQRHLPCVMSLKKSAVCVKNAWRVATAMTAQQIDHHGFGHYFAEDYLALIDHPVEMGSFSEIEFHACGVPHRMVLTGVFSCDLPRLKRDLKRICEYQIQLFGEPAPVTQYLFQVMVTGSDYGGLEHRNSTALICSRNDLPYVGMETPSEGYLQFLELCSHEYFHTWNVKRLMPKAYQNPDLSQPIYSRQLWWFEGVTSYYDALTLVRCGLIDYATYLALLSQQLTRVYRMPGRLRQSVAESSFLTWTKFYQQDENAPNAIISYYTKGSLLALALDLLLRQQTKGAMSLDTILLALWRDYGLQGIGLEEHELERLCSHYSGLDLSDFFARFLDGTQEPDLATLFTDFGLEFALRPAQGLVDLGGCRTTSTLKVDLGIQVQETAQQSLRIQNVWQESSAQLAGLSAGDEMIAINQVRVSSKSQLEQLLKRALPNAVWQCAYFRRDELRTTEITLKAAIQDRVVLQPLVEIDASHRQQLELWLGKQG